MSWAMTQPCPGDGIRMLKWRLAGTCFRVIARFVTENRQLRLRIGAHAWHHPMLVLEQTIADERRERGDTAVALVLSVMPVM